MIIPIPSRRKLGSAALIIAGIGAFMVPFLLHSPTTQGTSNNNNNGGTNPNNGSHTTTPTTTTPSTTTTTTGTTGDDKGSGGSDEGSGSTGTCADENSSHSDVSDQTNAARDTSVSHNTKDTSDSSKTSHGHAYGLLKNQMETTVALVKSMGTHNAAFHLHHDTKTDNKTVHTEQASSETSNDHDSSCAEKEETNDD
jgi:hypothetical protein